MQVRVAEARAEAAIAKVEAAEAKALLAVGEEERMSAIAEAQQARAQGRFAHPG